jgi:FAD dependent oxidoreductase
MRVSAASIPSSWSGSTAKASSTGRPTHPGWAGNPLSHYERTLEPGTDFERQSFNPEGAGTVMSQMLHEAGVTALYGTSFVDAVVEAGAGDGRIRAIIVENASGTQAPSPERFSSRDREQVSWSRVQAPLSSGAAAVSLRAQSAGTALAGRSRAGCSGR